MSKGKKGNGDYEVGYGRPPEHTRFKKNQSGNTLGRPTKKSSVADIFTRELSSKVTINGPMGPETITKKELLIRSHLNDAIKGKAAAFKWAILMMARLGIDEESKTWQQFTPEMVQEMHDKSKKWLELHEKKNARLAEVRKPAGDPGPSS